MAGASTTTTATSTAPVSEAAACDLPRLPPAPGPAGGIFTGGPVTETFTLDHGHPGDQLTVSPPPAGERPSVPAAAAECDALAASVPLTSSIPEPQNGVSIGYGLVTVANSVLTGAYADLSDVMADNEHHAVFPPPTPYRSRLAWVVIDTGSGPISSGTAAPEISAPAFGGTSLPVKPATTTPAVDYHYQVFILDAVSGTDPLVYSEDTYAQIPSDRWSVPWTLKSVSAADHGYSGTIEAQVLSCDGYRYVWNVDRNGPGLQVTVDRPIGPACGPAQRVPMTVQAATVFQTLPATIEHDPTGLVITNPFQTDTRPSPAEPPIITLSSTSYATTVTAPVGAVFVITPLTTGFDNDVPAATSSNPAVVSELTTQPAPGGEYRAWEAGTATLTIPKQACTFDKPPCTAPWYVNLVVTP